VTAIGTGGKRYAKAFIEDEAFPFPVLLDEDGTAADIIETKTIGLTTYLSPTAVGAGLKSFARGHRQKKTGRRPLQLGATVVIGPGNELLYADYEDHAGDHADLDEVLVAAR
jgi:peroxiredoxin